MSLRVLGLDLSYTASGVGRINDDGASVRTIRPGARTGDERMDWIVCEVCEEFRWAQLCIVEDKFVGANPSTGLQLAELHGCIKRELYRHEIPYVYVTTQHLKMYATGSGSNKTEKAAVIAAVRSRYADQLGGPSVVRDDNQADAFILAALARHAYGQPLVPVPVANARAINAVKWPTLNSLVGVSLAPLSPTWASIAKPDDALI